MNDDADQPRPRGVETEVITAVATPAGITAVTQRGAVVGLELILGEADPTGD